MVISASTPVSGIGNSIGEGRLYAVSAGFVRGGYVRLELGAAQPRVEFVRVAYDVEAAARQVIDAGLPEEFAEFLRTGGRPDAS